MEIDSSLYHWILYKFGKGVLCHTVRKVTNIKVASVGFVIACFNYHEGPPLWNIGVSEGLCVHYSTLPTTCVHVYYCDEDLSSVSSKGALCSVSQTPPVIDQKTCLGVRKSLTHIMKC